MIELKVDHLDDEFSTIFCQICGEPLEEDNIYGKCVKCYFEELETN